MTQAATEGMTTCRRQRPIWITSGMLDPTGTFWSWKLPPASVTALTSGEPEAWAPHCSQATPGVNGATGALGT